MSLTDQEMPAAATTTAPTTTTSGGRSSCRNTARLPQKQTMAETAMASRAQIKGSETQCMGNAMIQLSMGPQ